jgi:uncharacterized protein (UPF0335 family)
MNSMGHNSGTKTTFAQDQLRSIVERVERLEEEKKTITSDVKEVYAEAKGNGFDTKILRKVISLRKKEPIEREEEQSMLDIYMAALGMQPDLFDDEEVSPEVQGERDGLAGKAPDENTLRKGGKDASAYMAGWHRGQRQKLASFVAISTADAVPPLATPEPEKRFQP